MTKLMLLFMLLGATGDLASTEYVLAHEGGYEKNPLMRNRTVRITANIGVPVAVFFLLRNDKPTLEGKIFFFIHIGSKIYATTHNIYVGVTMRW